MKKVLLLVGAMAACVAAKADALKQNLVPANARWVLHLDGDAFKTTKIGSLIVNDKADAKVDQLKADSKLDLDFSFKKITALTAFGSKIGEEKEAVLIMQTKADVRGDLEKLIGWKEKNGNGEPPIARISVNGVETYKLGNDLNAVQASPGVWLLGKNNESLQAARDVALGKADSLKKADFLNYPAGANSFFFLAVADTGGANLPAQAKVLQKAEGLKFTIGEAGDNLALDLALRSKDAEGLMQMQQILQGLIALGTLSQDNKDLSMLAQNARVSTNDNFVNVSLRLPLEVMMQKVRQVK